MENTMKTFKEFLEDSMSDPINENTDKPNLIKIGETLFRLPLSHKGYHIFDATGRHVLETSDENVAKHLHKHLTSGIFDVKRAKPV